MPCLAGAGSFRDEPKACQRRKRQKIELLIHRAWASCARDVSMSHSLYVIHARGVLHVIKFLVMFGIILVHAYPPLIRLRINKNFIKFYEELSDNSRQLRRLRRIIPKLRSALSSVSLANWKKDKLFWNNSNNSMLCNARCSKCLTIMLQRRRYHAPLSLPTKFIPDW